MDKHYWNNTAAKYDAEILDSINTDRRRIIQRRLRKFYDREHRAADFGCGVGKYLPALSRGFRSVCAIDHAGKLLDLARTACAGLDNVSFIEADLARRPLKIQPVHFAVCTNVLIMPQAKRRAAIVRNVHRNLLPGGGLLMLIASVESALFANQRLLEWNRRCGVSLRAARKQAIVPSFQALDGVIDREGVPHKHYLKEETIVMLDAAGFDTLSVDRVEYPWTTEFADPPKWMKAPHPWDWLFTCRKR